MQTKIRAVFWVLVAGVTVYGTAAWAADVLLYAVVKGQGYEQSSDDLPGPALDTPYAFTAEVVENVADSVAYANLTVPGGTTKSLTRQGGGVLLLYDVFGTQAEMDAAYPGGTYLYTISTANDGLKSNLPLSVPTASWPTTPHISNWSAAQAIDASQDFTLTWDAWSGGSAQDIVMVEILDGTGNLVLGSPGPYESGALNGTSTSFLIPAGTLQPGVQYHAALLFIKVANFDVFSYFGAIGVTAYARATYFTITTAGVPPLPPIKMRASAISATEVFLQWKDMSDNEAKFKVKYSLTGTSDWVTVANVISNVNYCYHSNLTPGITYFYKVRAQNPYGKSSWSHIASATPLFSVVPPAAPTDLIATVTGANEVTLSWTDHADNESGFRIQKRQSLDKPWGMLVMVGANITTFVDKLITPGTTYYYRVKAYNPTGNSDKSNIATVTP